MNSKTIDNAINFVKEFFAGESSGHDYFHTMRVFNNAKLIIEKINESLDEELCLLAALLHDTDDVKLSPETSKNKDNARSFLKSQNYDEDKIDLICLIIDEVSFKGKDSVVPATIEGKIVQDADRLDAIGAIGIARAFAYGGKHNKEMYDPDDKPALNLSKEEYFSRKSTSINHFYEKLLLLEDMMNTEVARQIAKSRTDYMKNYLEEFFAEWNGER